MQDGASTSNRGKCESFRVTDLPKESLHVLLKVPCADVLTRFSVTFDGSKRTYRSFPPDLRLLVKRPMSELERSQETRSLLLATPPKEDAVPEVQL